MQELPGEFTTFDFIPGIPAPFNFGLAILSNQKMLTLWEKLQTAPPLLPMLIEGQPFIDAQDELSVTDFMRKYGMPERINEEVFIAMAKALDFIDPGKSSSYAVQFCSYRCTALSTSIYPTQAPPPDHSHVHPSSPLSYRTPFIPPLILTHSHFLILSLAPLPTLSPLLTPLR